MTETESELATRQEIVQLQQLQVALLLQIDHAEARINRLRWWLLCHALLLLALCIIVLVPR